MGRRSLRKVDPALDLSAYLKTLDDLSAGGDLASWFQRDARLEVEMGSGKGLFLAGAAAENPERNFLGVELAARYARFAAARLARKELTNAVMVSGDGLRLFREFLPDSSICAIHVYFPDPWWKKRHKKRRVMNPAFLADIQRTLVPGGELHFWTDVQEYFIGTLALITDHTHLEGPFEVAAQEATHDLDYRTHFERRMRLHNLPVYRSRFLRSVAADSPAC